MDSVSCDDVYFSFLGFEFSGDKFEDGGFSGSILSHDGDFCVLADSKIALYEDRMFFVIMERYVIETENYGILIC
jgi:hypothetical protein